MPPKNSNDKSAYKSKMKVDLEEPSMLRGFGYTFSPTRISEHTRLSTNSSNFTPLARYCNILHYTILYYTILYYTILYYTILYYTIL